jgi:hypothetical protein
MPNQPHSICAECGQRIHRFECLWKELASGDVRASYALDLEAVGRHDRRVWHPDCLPQDARHLVAA